MAGNPSIRETHVLFDELISVARSLTQDTQPYAEIRSVSRWLDSEAVMFAQRSQRLMLMSHSSLDDKDIWKVIEGKLGHDKTASLQNDLHAIRKALEKLRVDIDNFNIGTEVFDKLRSKPENIRKNRAETNVQKHLDRLSKANSNFSSRVSDPGTVIPHYTGPQTLPNFRIFSNREEQPSTTIFYFISEGHSCQCRGNHLVRPNCLCSNCKTGLVGADPENGWVCDLLYRYEAKKISNGLLSPRASNKDASTDTQRRRSDVLQQYVRKESMPQSGGVTVRTEAAYSLAAKHWNGPYSKTSDFVTSQLAGGDETNHERMGKPDIEDSTFSQILDTVKFKTTLSAPKDYLRRSQENGREKILQAAFRLSSFVLKLMAYPSMKDTQTLDNWTISIGYTSKKDLDIKGADRGFYSAKISIDKTNLLRRSEEVSRKQPALMRLGNSLIELAFGQSLDEIRRGSKSPFTKVSQQKLDALAGPVADFVTARGLISSHRIRNEFGPGYESAVSACIFQQYQQNHSLALEEFDIQKESFFEHAKCAILAPLYRELHKYSQLDCGEDHFDASTPEKARGRAHELPPDLERANANYAESVDTSNRTERQLGSVLTGKRDLTAPQTTCDSTGVRGDFSGAVEGTSHSCQSCSLSDSQAPVVLTVQTSDKAGLFIRHIEQRQHEEDVDTDAQAETKVSSYEGGSAYSDDSLTDLDSAFSSTYSRATGNSLKLAPLGENHPLLAIQDTAVALIFQKYNEHLRSCAGESSGNPATLSPVQYLVPGNGNGFGNGISMNVDMLDNEQSTRTSKSASRKKVQTSENADTFACPYLKKDEARYQKCAKYVNKRIRDVKQHLKRYHEMPIYCAVCCETFDSEEDRDTHTRARNCQESRFPRPEGINGYQRDQLKRKAQANQSPDQQWYGIFDILFPNHQPRPASPYINTALLENVLGYHAFLMQSGVDHLRGLLQEHGLGIFTVPDRGQDFNSLLDRVLRAGLAALFEQYSSPGTPSSQSAAAENMSAMDTTRSTAALNQTVPRGYQVDFDTTPASSSAGNTNRSDAHYASSTPSDYSYHSSNHNSFVNTGHPAARFSLYGGIAGLPDTHLQDVDTAGISYQFSDMSNGAFQFLYQGNNTNADHMQP